MWLFRRSHEYIVMLPRRGGRKILFKVKAKDPSEASEKALARLEEMQDSPELRSYKYIILMDSKTLNEFKIDNPFFHEEEEEETKQQRKRVITKDDIEQLTIASVVEQIPQLVSSVFNIAMNIANQAASAITESFMQQMGLKPQDPKLMVAQSLANVLNTMAENPQAFFGAIKNFIESHGGGEAPRQTPSGPVIIRRRKE